MQKTICFIVLLCIWGCRESENRSGANRKKDSINKVVRDAAHDIAGNFSDQSSLRFSSARVDTFFARYDSLRPCQSDLNKFYSSRNFAFAWHTETGGLTEQASHLYMRLENLPEEGLNLVLPYKRTLDSLININNTQTIEQKTETELLLTSLYFFFAQRYGAGWKKALPSRLTG
jgi:hypothetical protein